MSLGDSSLCEVEGVRLGLEGDIGDALGKGEKGDTLFEEKRALGLCSTAWGDRGDGGGCADDDARAGMCESEFVCACM